MGRMQFFESQIYATAVTPRPFVVFLSKQMSPCREVAMPEQKKQDKTSLHIFDIKDDGSPRPRRGFFRQFYYDLLLFCGVQTESNLSSIRKEPVKTRGIFLFRK